MIEFIIEILKSATQKTASDVFLIAGHPVAFKIGGKIIQTDTKKLMPDDTKILIEELYKLANRNPQKRFYEDGDDDFSLSINNLGRFRISAYKQRGSYAAVLRVVSFELPDPKKLGIPINVLDLSKKQNGLVIVTGPAGSGKSTTLSCLISEINNSRECHVMTLEDPIEYVYKHNKSIISQREIASDTESYVSALKAVLRQAPDVILIGEMRDSETISIAMTAAETGHLVFSTLHTLGAANSIGRIIDAFPPHQQNQVRLQLSMVLQAVVSQQLILNLDNEQSPVFELMLANTAIKTLIRDSKLHQIDTVIFSGVNQGMVTMDNSIINLYKDGKISKENAILHSSNPSSLEKRL